MNAAKPAATQVLRNWVCGLVLAATAAVACGQQAQLQEAQRLQAQVIKLHGEGRYERAIAPARRALAIHEKVLGAEHPTTATSLNNLAALYRETGAYPNAEPLYTRALAIREKVLGAEHPDTARSLNGLAMLYDDAGAYAKAEPLYTRALAIYEKALGAEHQDTARSMSNLAALYRATGAYVKAEPLFTRALKIRETVLGAEHPETAQSLNHLAALHSETGAYAKAEPLLTRALAINEKVLGAGHPDTALSLNSLATLYGDTGAYAKAEPLFTRALAINEKVLGAGHPDTALSLNNLAALYTETGAYAKAEPLYTRALAIREKVLGPEHPDTVRSMSSLAALYGETGAFAKAERLDTRALAIREKVLGAEHPDTATSLNNLALLYRDTGAFVKAEPLLIRALAIHEKVQGVEHPDTATSLNNLASLYRDTGAYAKAEPLCTRALVIREKALGPEHPDTILSLESLATLHLSNSREAAAFQLFARAGASREAHFSRVLATGSEQRRVELLGTHSISGEVTAAVQHPASGGAAVGATAVLRRKGRALEASAAAAAQLRANLSSADRELFDRLSQVAEQRARLAVDGPGSMPLAQYRKRIDELTQQQDRLQAELSGRSVEAGLRLKPVRLEDVVQAIPPDALLIEWVRYSPYDFKAVKDQRRWGAPRYAAFVLSRNAPPRALDLGPADAVDEQLRALRTSTADAASREHERLSRALYGALLEPLLPAPAVVGIKRLLLSPDAQLNLVPFAALRDGSGRWLDERFELSLLTSGRDLLRIAAGIAPARGGDWIFANPDFGLPPPKGLPSKPSADAPEALGAKYWGRLPQTAVEAAVLQKLLQTPAARVLTDARATKAALKQVAAPRILHLATHGYFLDAQPGPATSRGRGGGLAGIEAKPDAPGPDPQPLLRSGLVLAGANAKPGEGILTAAEAAQLNLGGTQLITLSACETGLGELRQGEGVYGLRRALVLAGAQSQLVSLWKVDDEATQRLMTEFYRRLLSGEGRAAALQAAQRVLRGNPAFAHPAYWAAFTLVGDWRPLQGR